MEGIHNKEGNREKEKKNTYLALNSTSFVVALSAGSHGTTNTNTTIGSLDTASLGHVLLALLLADLHLLFFAAAAELIRTELVPGLELCAAVLGDVTFRHGG